MNKTPGAPSILSGDLLVVGTLQSDGEVQLDGQVDGDVKAGALIVGEKAAVKGEVSADSVTIRGRVLGTVRGRQVQLASTARIEGDIFHNTLSIESGAYFHGKCEHLNDPLNAAGGDRPGVAVSSARPADGGHDPSVGPRPQGGVGPASLAQPEN